MTLLIGYVVQVSDLCLYIDETGPTWSIIFFPGTKSILPSTNLLRRSLASPKSQFLLFRDFPGNPSIYLEVLCGSPTKSA